MPTYRIATWDHTADDWSLFLSGITKWALRGHIRELLAAGWDYDFSILIQREPTP